MKKLFTSLIMFAIAVLAVGSAVIQAEQWSVINQNISALYDYSRFNQTGTFNEIKSPNNNRVTRISNNMRADGLVNADGEFVASNIYTLNSRGLTTSEYDIQNSSHKEYSPSGQVMTAWSTMDFNMNADEIDAAVAAGTLTAEEAAAAKARPLENAAGTQMMARVETTPAVINPDTGEESSPAEYKEVGIYIVTKRYNANVIYNDDNGSYRIEWTGITGNTTQSGTAGSNGNQVTEYNVSAIPMVTKIEYFNADGRMDKEIKYAKDAAGTVYKAGETDYLYDGKRQMTGTKEYVQATTQDDKTQAVTVSTLADSWLLVAETHYEGGIAISKTGHDYKFVYGNGTDKEPTGFTETIGGGYTQAKYNYTGMHLDSVDQFAKAGANPNNDPNVNVVNGTQRAEGYTYHDVTILFDKYGRTSSTLGVKDDGSTYLKSQYFYNDTNKIVVNEVDTVNGPIVSFTCQGGLERVENYNYTNDNTANNFKGEILSKDIQLYVNGNENTPLVQFREADLNTYGNRNTASMASKKVWTSWGDPTAQAKLTVGTDGIITAEFTVTSVNKMIAGLDAALKANEPWYQMGLNGSSGHQDSVAEHDRLQSLKDNIIAQWTASGGSYDSGTGLASGRGKVTATVGSIDLTKLWVLMRGRQGISAADATAELNGLSAEQLKTKVLSSFQTMGHQGADINYSEITNTALNQQILTSALKGTGVMNLTWDFWSLETNVETQQTTLNIFVDGAN